MSNAPKKILDVKDLEKCISMSPCVASYGIKDKKGETRSKFIRIENFIAHDYNEVIKYTNFVEDLDVDFDSCICKDNNIVDCIALCESNSGEKYVVGIDFTSIIPTCEEIKNKRIGCLSQDLVSNSKTAFVVIVTRGIPIVEKHIEECSNNIAKHTIEKSNIYEKICKAPNSAIFYLMLD